MCQNLNGLACSLLLLGTLSCSKAPPPDPICRYEPLPESAEGKVGQGAIQIAGSSDEYFRVRDSSGKEIAHGLLNSSVFLKPGEYQAQVNNSAHKVSLQAKTLTKCLCGTILMTGNTDE